MTTSLAQRIRNSLEGSYPTEAAAIVIAEAVSHTLLDKIRPAIDDDPDRERAWIDWDHAVEISSPFSSGERRLIVLAASLATGTHLINANDTFSGLDDTNARIVLDAIAHSLQVHQW